MTTTDAPTVRLTAAEVAADLRALAAERPDYTYASPIVLGEWYDDDEDAHRTGLHVLDTCHYFHPQTGEPSCIVGHVLARHGVQLEQVARWNEDVKLTEMLSVGPEVGIVMEGSAATMLQRAQDAQDHGTPWAEAVTTALQLAP